jgi:hypothetical protein
MKKKSLSSIITKTPWDKIDAWQEHSDFVQ